MELFVFWLALCGVVAVAASSKGRSGPGFFLLSLFLSPLIGGLIALVVPRITPVPVQIVNRQWAEPPAIEPAPPPEDWTRVVGALADLRDRGAISEDEYAAKKSELLARV